MGKLNIMMLEYLHPEEFRVLTAIEMGMKNRQVVPTSLAAQIANMQPDKVEKLLQELRRRPRLLCFEHVDHYDGYRLTNSGYDYLALKVLARRGVIVSLGNQIGTVKESNIYLAADETGNPVCLKFHRLGRPRFKNIQDKRDYHRHGKIMSWLYLSSISATREFAYMKALLDHGFPVPKPIDFNRHCVVMEFIEGTPLCSLYEVDDVEALYQDLMGMICRLANYGVIHADFNEFNIIISNDKKPIIINFRKILSTRHENAETYFDRDVNCMREFFKRRFAYESKSHPMFSDISREECVEIEVEASGLTKQMEKDFLIEMGMEEESEKVETKNNDDEIGNSENLSNEIEKLKLEVEKALQEYYESVDENIRLKNIQSRDLVGQESNREKNIAGRSNSLCQSSNEVLDDHSGPDNQSVYSEASSNVQSIGSISTATTTAPDVI